MQMVSLDQDDQATQAYRASTGYPRGGPWLWFRAAYSPTVRILFTMPATAHIIVLGSGINGDVL
jgi:hypothetical protein